MSLALALQYGTLIITHAGTIAKVVKVVADLAHGTKSNDEKKDEAKQLLKDLVDDKVMSDQQLDDIIESVYKGLKFFGLIHDVTSSTPPVAPTTVNTKLNQ